MRTATYIDGEIILLVFALYLHQKAVKEIFGEFINWFRGKDVNRWSLL